MKKIFLCALMMGAFLHAKAQTVLPGDYKIINLGDNVTGDFTRSLILLHEMYGGALVGRNYAVGTITAMRGASDAYNRLDVVSVNTSSAYNTTAGTITSFNDNANSWALKTCTYVGKKYLALEVPYAPGYHQWGFWFNGSTKSTGESLKSVPYEVSGNPVNQNLISNIQDYSSAMSELHSIANMSVTGNIGVGTSDTKGYKLAVNGKIRTQEIKVENSNWPDFVFNENYELTTLAETAKSIKEKGHLPGIPSAAEVKENGVDLGNMNAKLLQKIEELTLHLIKQEERLNKQEEEIKILKSKTR